MKELSSKVIKIKNSTKKDHFAAIVNFILVLSLPLDLMLITWSRETATYTRDFNPILTLIAISVLLFLSFSSLFQNKSFALYSKLLKKRVDLLKDNKKVLFLVGILFLITLLELISKFKDINVTKIIGVAFIVIVSILNFLRKTVNYRSALLIKSLTNSKQNIENFTDNFKTTILLASSIAARLFSLLSIFLISSMPELSLVQKLSLSLLVLTCSLISLISAKKTFSDPLFLCPRCLNKNYFFDSTTDYCPKCKIGKNPIKAVNFTFRKNKRSGF